MNICIYGAASDDIADVFKKDGELLGEKLARRGHGLVFGGGSAGLMGAVARGASRGDGHIISIAPSFFDVDGVLYAECDEYIFTETMRERKQKMEDLSEGFIITPGGIGTFDEFFEIFTLRQLGRHQKPIAILNTDGYYDDLLAMLRHTAKLNFMDSRNMELFFASEDVDQLLDYIENPPHIQFDIKKLRRIEKDT
ncbi:MAG: TIGR00730 family Rossman fold protein [Ruminococcus sp.]|nr:TIGR00730 family Rossman fold protein [Ruminococcus sp.]MBQ9515257.1 TIGR00730 family Rossman fold protein [Ruminococcus sp.]